MPDTNCRTVDAEDPSASTKTILFIDDEDMLVEMNLSRFSKMGYRVVGCKSPTEALNTFKAAPDQFDLVVTDYTMPHMSGFDLAREILAVRPGAPILLLSGGDEVIAPEKVTEAGIKVYASKVASRGELEELIQQALQG